MSILKRKGQVTLFVIIAVLVVGAIIGFYLLSGNQTRSNIPENSKVSVLRDNTLDCMSDLYVDALVDNGLHGGYLIVDDGLANGYFEIPYYYKQGIDKAPSIQKVEQALEDYVNVATRYCIDYSAPVAQSQDLGIRLNRIDLLNEDFSGFEVSYNKIDSEAVIRNGEVEFTTHLDMNIIDSEGNSYILAIDEYPETIESDLYLMHNIAIFYSNSLANNDEGVCLSCLDEMAREREINVDITGYIEDDTELVILTSTTRYPLVFQFLNKYSDVGGEELEVEFIKG